MFCGIKWKKEILRLYKRILLVCYVKLHKKCVKQYIYQSKEDICICLFKKMSNSVLTADSISRGGLDVVIYY